MVVLNFRSVGFESDNRSTGARLGVYVGSLWAARSDDPDARRVPSRYGRLRPATVRAEHRSKHRSRPQQGLERLEKSRVYASHRAWARRPSGRAANAANNGPAAGVAVGSCRDTLAQTGADVRTLTSPGSLSTTSDGTTFPHKEDTCAEMRAESVAARLHMPARPPLTTQLAPLCRTW